MLILPVTAATRMVLVSPHYPENVGAAARAMKTMGLTDLTLVKPGRLARPEHEMAHKMAVKSWDILQAARVCSTLAEAIDDIDYVLATTSRRGVSGVLPLRSAARRVREHADSGGRIAFLFGNEKTGLDKNIVESADDRVRIPIAADQPSINLAQAVQLVSYELFVAGLEARDAGRCRG